MTKALGLVPIGLLALVSLSFIGMVIFYPPLVWVDTLLDDAYYYLGVARNISLGHGSTFVQPFETNGYHPLWLLILTGMSYLIGGDRYLVVAGTHLLGAIALAGFLWISKREKGLVWPAALTVLCYPATFLLGMEVVLLPVLTLIYFRQEGYRRGVLASLVFLTRIDALVLMVGRALYELVTEGRLPIWETLILVPVCLIYFGVNYTVFGTIVPVSGMAKAIGNLKGENYLVLYAYGLMFFPPLVLIGLKIWSDRSVKTIKNRKEIFTLSFAILVSAFYYFIFSGWGIYPWYYWSIALIFYYLLFEILNVRHRILIFARNFFVAIMIFHGTTEFIRIYAPLLGYYSGVNTLVSAGQENLKLVEMINASDLPAVMIAMGDSAGSFGYFLNEKHSFLHTEGLVASLDYVRALEAGEALAFIESAGADYYVSHRDKYWIYGETYAMPEPFQGLSMHHGLMLLCFDKASEVEKWARPVQSLKIFPMSERLQCPDEAIADFETRKASYAMVRGTSFREGIIGPKYDVK